MGLAPLNMPGKDDKAKDKNQKEPKKEEKNIIRRFQSWELNGRGKPTGVYPIPDQLEPDNYSEVESTRKGEIVEIREYHDGNPKPLVRKFTIGKNGRLEKQDYADPLTAISGQDVYEYDDKGMMTARSEYDAAKRLRYRIEVTCDANGRFKEEKILDAAKRGVMRHAYTLDGNGRMLKDESFGGKDLKELQGFHTFEYDTKGRITRRAWCEPKGKEKEAFAYKYDEFDRRVEMAIEKDGKISMKSVTEFDDKGKVKTTKYVDGSGKNLAEEKKEFEPLTAKQITETMASLDNKIKEVAKSDPKKLEAIAQVGYAQFEAGQYDEARRIFEGLVTIMPDNAYYLSAVAAVALQQDQAQTALNYYERALRRDKKHTASLVGKGDAQLRLGRVDQALASLQDAIKVAKPDDPALRRARAIIAALTQQAEGGGKAAPAPAPAADKKEKDKKGKKK